MPGHTHRPEWARLFFLQLLGMRITVRSEWAVFPLLFLGFLDQLIGGPAHKYFFSLPFRGCWGYVSLKCHFLTAFSKDHRFFYNAFFRQKIIMVLNFVNALSLSFFILALFVIRYEKLITFLLSPAKI